MTTASTLDVEEQLRKDAKTTRKQKAEEKRLMGFEQIKAMTWKNEAGKDPLAVLPEEMWVKVMSYLNSPHDLENARLSCPLFEHLLEPRRLSDILLPQVLQVKEFQRHLKLRSDVDNGKARPFRHILKLRRVSKAWRKQVDRFFDQNLDKNKMSFNTSEDYPFLRTGNPSSPRERHRMPKSFYEMSQSSGSVRFISRSIHVHLELFENRVDVNPIAYQNEMQEFSARLVKLLEVVGSQVWDFQFETAPLCLMVGKGVTLCELYRHLVSWIGLMPQLKYLDIEFAGKYFPVKNGEKALRQTIGRQAFPCMDNLKLLSLSYGKEFVTAGGLPILESILSRNQHVKHLRIDGELCTGNKRLSGLINSLRLET